MMPRIPITEVRPVVENGRYPVKSTLHEPFRVSARVFREGHDRLGAEVVLTGPDGVDRPPAAMTDLGNDLHRAWVRADDTGAWTFRVESWSDPYATWSHDAAVKVAAGVDVELMLLEGAVLLERAGAGLPTGPARILADAATTLRDRSADTEARLAAAVAAPVRRVLTEHPLRDLLGCSPAYPLVVDRHRAVAGAWYELFPRSEGAVRAADGSVRPGTLRTAARRLPAIAAMGFDVVYLPPVHPIGTTNRKGPNNSLTAGPDDPGSPWAIGSAAGGHDAVHPELGTIHDFDAFVAEAARLGLEVALDLALQCAPDHPWVAEHPEWFRTRVDGSIAYAENPPKRYQDIYPLAFDNDPDGLYDAILGVLRHWMAHGVRIFRVDNPHTKPLPFWERLLADVRSTDPDVVFLSEAFTRPAMLRALGTVGFHQSYTYFTWRNTKAELEEYLTELSHETAHMVRPNLFVNTPDILTAYLQHGGPAAFRIRAAIAATAGPSWGMYAGFELAERVAVHPGSEDYLDSEKYQVVVRDWEHAESLAPYVTRLNAIRHAHPALLQLGRFTVHASDSDAVLCYSKRLDDDVVIVVVNVDPHRTQESTVHLDMPALGLDWGASFTADDELGGRTWTWAEHNYVRLDPDVEPAHVIVVRRAEDVS